jgi:DNA-binding CsgD family transcriptional regulator
MSFWRHLRNLLGRSEPAGPRPFSFDAGLLESLQEIADQEQRSPEELASHLLRRAVNERRSMQAAWEQWQTLTPRERDMVALICLDFTTRQIAARYNISTETVKTHVGNALEKFGVRNRMQLRQRLIGWDFSAWDDRAQARDEGAV